MPVIEQNGNEINPLRVRECLDSLERYCQCAVTPDRVYMLSTGQYMIIATSREGVVWLIETRKEGTGVDLENLSER